MLKSIRTGLLKAGVHPSIVDDVVSAVFVQLCRDGWALAAMAHSS